MAVIKGVHFYYAKLKNPALMYQRQEVEGKPHMNKEFVVDVLIPEKTFQALKKKFKTVKSIKNVREFDAAEFEEAFKAAPPYEADTYYVVKFNKLAFYKDGNKADGPNVVGIVGGRKDRDGNEISVDVALGNGTAGAIQFRERTWDNTHGKGMTLDLLGVQVASLVPYESSGHEDEFDYEDDEFSDGGEETFGEDDGETSDGESATETEEDDW